MGISTEKLADINLKNVKKYYISAVTIGCLIQIVFFFSIDVLISCLSIFISTVAVALYLFRPVIFLKNPISAFQIFVFHFFLIGGTVVIRSLEIDSIANDLALPATTFFYTAYYSVFLILIHYLYTKITFFSNIIKGIQKVYKKINLFYIINPTQMWILSIFGILSFTLVLVLVGNVYDTQNADKVSNPIVKLLNGVSFLYVVPTMIIFYQNFFLKEITIPKIALICYFSVVFIISIVFNTRGLLLGPVVILLYYFFFLFFNGRITFTKKIKRISLILLISSAFLFPLVSRFSNALLLSRGDRYSVSGLELLKITIGYMFDNDKLAEAKNEYESSKENKVYNEYYFKSSFVNRLFLIKFVDNMNVMTDKLDKDEKALLLVKIFELLKTILPTPVSNALGIKVDKKDFGYSEPDLIGEYNGASSLGTFISGMGFMQGTGLMGLGWYSLFFFVQGIVVFIYADSFKIMRGKEIYFSPLFILVINQINLGTFFLNGAITSIFFCVARNWLQDIVIYSLILIIIKAITKGKPNRNLA